MRQYCLFKNKDCFIVLQKIQKGAIPKLYLLAYNNQKKQNIEISTKSNLLQQSQQQLKNTDKNLDFVDYKTMKILLSQIKNNQTNKVLFFNKLNSKTYLSHIYQSLLNSLLVICQTYQIDTLNISGNQFNDLRILQQSELLQFTQIENLILNDNDISSQISLQFLEQLDQKIKYISVYSNPICNTEQYIQNSLNLQTRLVPNMNNFENQCNKKNPQNIINILKWDQDSITIQENEQTHFIGIDFHTLHLQNLLLEEESYTTQIINSKLPKLIRYVQVSAQFIYTNINYKIFRYLEVEIPTSVFEINKLDNINIIYDVITVTK